MLCSRGLGFTPQAEREHFDSDRSDHDPLQLSLPQDCSGRKKLCQFLQHLPQTQISNNLDWSSLALFTNAPHVMDCAKHLNYGKRPETRLLTSFVFYIDSDEYSLRQSTYHPSLWFVVRAPCPLRPRTVRPAFGERRHVAAFLAYVDDFLAAGSREALQSQPLLARLLDVWKGSNPNFLGRQPGDVDTMRFLGLDIRVGPEDCTWLVHHRAISMPFFKRGLTQSVSRIVELEVSQNHSLTSHMFRRLANRNLQTVFREFLDKGLKMGCSESLCKEQSQITVLKSPLTRPRT